MLQTIDDGKQGDAHKTNGDDACKHASVIEFEPTVHDVVSDAVSRGEVLCEK